MDREQEWRPFCGQEYARSESGLHARRVARILEGSSFHVPHVSGDPVICDLPPHETTGKDALKHKNTELEFEWW